jgi:hypothetical protein
MLAEQAPHRGEIKQLIAMQQSGRNDLERLLRSESEALRREPQQGATSVP